MDTKKELLIKTAARLYSVGVEVETARERVRELAASGAPYGSREMLTAVAEFRTLEERWRNLEKQYLDLRDEVTEE